VSLSFVRACAADLFNIPDKLLNTLPLRLSFTGWLSTSHGPISRGLTRTRRQSNAHVRRRRRRRPHTHTCEIRDADRQKASESVDVNTPLVPAAPMWKPSKIRRLGYPPLCVRWTKRSSLHSHLLSVFFFGGVGGERPMCPNSNQ